MKHFLPVILAFLSCVSKQQSQKVFLYSLKRIQQVPWQNALVRQHDALRAGFVGAVKKKSGH